MIAYTTDSKLLVLTLHSTIDGEKSAGVLALREGNIRYKEATVEIGELGRVGLEVPVKATWSVIRQRMHEVRMRYIQEG